MQGEPNTRDAVKFGWRLGERGQVGISMQPRQSKLGSLDNEPDRKDPPVGQHILKSDAISVASPPARSIRL